MVRAIGSAKLWSTVCKASICTRSDWCVVCIVLCIVVCILASIVCDANSARVSANGLVDQREFVGTHRKHRTHTHRHFPYTKQVSCEVCRQSCRVYGQAGVMRLLESLLLYRSFCSEWGCLPFSRVQSCVVQESLSKHGSEA